MYYLEVDASYNGSADSFDLKGNGNSYGRFAYADLPVRLGPFSDNDVVNELVMVDANNPMCSKGKEVNAPICGCDIEIRGVYPSCDGDGNYNFGIFYDTTNLDGNELILKINGVVYDYNASSSVNYISVGPIEPDSSQIYEIVLSDNENPDCLDWWRFESPSFSCECNISLIDYAVTDCIGDEYFIEVAFAYDLPFSEMHIAVNNEVVKDRYF